ncbi:MAG: prepilin-type N-terminal cleavage/methylation domain-containing protein [Gemmatimonadaceae bacterium]|jgi:prepilin-type N-terminal cleavage/methylation domain-containing protein|nr:prepilin-type N-terminal cleavage/methylation domain-containing protein [Gemmatimonadaceae bacterium]
MRRRGWTLLELVVVLTIVGTGLALAVPPLWHLRDRWLARRARDDLVLLLTAARWRAQVSGRAVVVGLGADGLATAEQPGWRLVRALEAAYGTTLRANRPSLVYRADGLAAGAANLTAVVGRGAVAETVRVSRLGRVR